jgi:hypothetical protein
MLKIGDFVKGTREADERYSVTNESMTLGIVSYVYDCRLDDVEYVDIVVIKHDRLVYIGRTYKVIPYLFDNVTTSYKPTRRELMFQKLLLEYRCDVPYENAYHRPVTNIISSGEISDIMLNINRCNLLKKYKKYIYKIR